MSKNNLNSSLISGRCIYLRKVKLSDANRTYLKWMLDRDVNRYLESRFTKHSMGTLRRSVCQMINDKNSLFLAIIDKASHKHIGNIKLGSINRIHGYADLGIMIGEKEFWGKGIASEAIKLACDYAFKVLKLHKVVAGVYSNNIGSIKSFKKCGFKIEGLRKKQYLCGGRYVDCVLLGLLKN